MNIDFLRYYFEIELYIENPPLDMKSFLDFCNQRGVTLTAEKLEDFEKRGWFFPIFRVKDFKENSSNIFLSLDFSQDYHDNFLKLLDENYIFVPNEKNFIEYSKFFYKNTRKRKIQSYYSNFQIHHIIFLLEHEGSEINLSEYLNHSFINLLIGTQIYLPYGRSNTHYINPFSKINVFNERLEKYNLDEVLSIIGLTEDNLYESYANICYKLEDLLGSNFAIQLWKHISWEKKDDCIGHTRLGIEYLQWAMMLKKCIEDYLGREIFDVDEIDMSWEDIKNIIPSEIKDGSIRAFRNENFTNEVTGDYEFNLNKKRLFYLCNSLTLDYHPKLILFVEGKIEREMFPKYFEFFGYNTQDIGIEIIDIGGISNFYGKKIKTKDVNQKYLDNIVSSYKHLINFNLKKWQAIPFFIGDNENNILDKLVEGKVFSINDLSEKFNSSEIQELKKEYLSSSNDKMLKGWTNIWEYDFELDNFTPNELKEAINEVCGTNYALEDINLIFESCQNGKKKGIKSLERVENSKLLINQKLLENLIDYYNKTHDETIWQRKIFIVIDKLVNMCIFNPSPVNTKHLMRNMDELNLFIKNGWDIFERNKYRI